jgi:hypothetical protein
MPTDNDVFNWPIMMPRDLKLRELYGFGARTQLVPVNAKYAEQTV